MLGNGPKGRWMASWRVPWKGAEGRQEVTGRVGGGLLPKAPMFKRRNFMYAHMHGNCSMLYKIDRVVAVLGCSLACMYQSKNAAHPIRTP